jgi:hypothetical protein
LVFTATSRLEISQKSSIIQTAAGGRVVRLDCWVSVALFRS